MASAPQISIRQITTPWSILSSISFTQTSPSGNTLPVKEGETSNQVMFRIYNNFGLVSNIATAVNISITTYDGVGISSHTCSTLPVSQCWIQIQEYGYGENSTTSPDRFTYFLGGMTSIGGNGPCGSSTYTPEIGSDGVTGSKQIRAFSTQSGMGYIEFNTQAMVPSSASSNTYNPAISMYYEWTT